MSVSRIYRVLRLVTMLQSGRNYTASELATELEVSRRTIFRDLNMLELAHIPYYYDRQRSAYRINNHFFLAPVNLNLLEALALLLSARRSGGSAKLPLAAASSRAAVKLESVLPAPVREYLGTVIDRVTVLPEQHARHEGLDGMFDRLVSAVAEGRVCRLVYISFAEKKQITTTVEPRRLIFVGRAWYLIAYSRMHHQRRTFKLGRVKKLTVTEKTFEPPEREEGDEGFGDAWRMIPEAKVYDIHLHFSPKVAGNVAEVNWHHSQQIEWNDDGSIEFRVRVAGLGEILWWILGYGDQVKVFSPVRLARKVTSMARRTLAKYEGRA